MREVKSLRRMQRLSQQWRRQAHRVGLVPTMGYLHEGHLSLVRCARKALGPSGQVVVSIYVNPIQFSPGEDLSRYPRDLRRDRALCRRAGVDCLFLPSDATMYVQSANARHSTYVVEEGLSPSMESGTRPGHFRGVTTVVAKLFNLVQPELAVFGAKDFQQAAVVRRMVRDLNYPLKIVVAPTVREPDGLAMSSRNAYLSTEQRAQAVVLWEVLRHLKTRVVAAGARGIAASVLRREVGERLAVYPAARLDYVAFFDPATLAPKPRVHRGCQAALAVYLGQTRLIDNVSLR